MIVTISNTIVYNEPDTGTLQDHAITHFKMKVRLKARNGLENATNHLKISTGSGVDSALQPLCIKVHTSNILNEKDVLVPSGNIAITS